MLDISQVSSNIMLKQAYISYAYKNPKWKYETIVELHNYIYSQTDPTQYNLLELEIKFGNFKAEGAYKNYFLFNKDIFKLPQYLNDNVNSINFESGLRESQFYALNYFLELECKKNSDIRKIEPLKYNETIYNSGKRKSEIYNLKNELIKIETIRKDEKHHIQLRNNSNDFRITIAKEFPSDVTDKDTVELFRDKFRISYKFRFFRLDLTIVSTSKSLQEKNFGGSVTYEVEFEFDEINIRAKDFENFEAFYKIIERYLDNAFSIYEVITKEYFSQFYAINKNSESIFGDYIENILKK